MAKRLLSRRTDLIDSSGIRKVFDLAAKMKDPINLSIGQPDFDLLPAVKERAKAAIDAGYNRYTQTRGLPELREAVSRKYAARGVKTEDSIITSGTSGGIMLALATILDDGDEVIIPDPYFVMYKHLVNFLGGKPVFVDTYPDFHLRRDTIGENQGHHHQQPE
jgi:aspartate aminotransferase